MDHIFCILICVITAVSRPAKPVSCLEKVFSKLLPGICRDLPVIYDEWTPGKPRKILLVGYNGARNTGSDVRTVAIARQLRTLFGPDEIRITVMTLDPGTMEGYFDKDVELLKFSSFFPLDIFRACSAHHAAILCECSTLTSR